MSDYFCRRRDESAKIIEKRTFELALERCISIHVWKKTFLTEEPKEQKCESTL